MAGDVGDLKTRLAENSDRLHLTVRVALGDQLDPRRAVVVIDQLEEVFTLCADPHQRTAFIENLTYASTVACGQTIVVVTVRADFFSKCLAYEGLATILSIISYSLAECQITSYGSNRGTGTIERLRIRPRSGRMLIDDVKGEAGGLPLLEYTLAQLWEKRKDFRLAVSTYKEIGGLFGALEKRANELLESLNVCEKEACKQIFLRLTQPGEGTEDTKRRAYRDELSQSAATQQVLHTLTEARLLQQRERKLIRRLS